MAYQFEGKVLASGQLANAKATLYTVPANTTAWVKFFVVYNTSAIAENVQAYVNPAGTSRTIYKNAALAGTTAQAVVGDAPIILEAGDLIEGNTTTAATVDYVICGVLETK